MGKEITPIRDIVKSVFTRIESGKTVPREEIESSWKEIVGDAGAKHSRPSDLRKKELIILVDSSGWMQELSLQKRQILKALKRKLGKDTISEIQFKIGEF